MIGRAAVLTCWFFGLWHRALELADCWVELGLDLKAETSIELTSINIPRGKGNLWWSSIQDLALPLWGLRFDPWLGESAKTNK